MDIKDVDSSVNRCVEIAIERFASVVLTQSYWEPFCRRDLDRFRFLVCSLSMLENALMVSIRRTVIKENVNGLFDMFQRRFVSFIERYGSVPVRLDEILVTAKEQDAVVSHFHTVLKSEATREELLGSVSKLSEVYQVLQSTRCSGFSGLLVAENDLRSALSLAAFIWFLGDKQITKKELSFTRDLADKVALISEYACRAVKENAYTPTEGELPAEAKSTARAVSLGEEKSPLTTKDFLTFLGMSIPALLAAKFVSVVLIDGIARGIYNRDLEDSTYLFITQFISCAVAAFVFVWVGSLPLKRLRWFSVWFFAGIAIAAALALSNVNSAQDFLGQCLGAVTSAVIFKNSKER